MKKALLIGALLTLVACGGRNSHFDSDIPGLTAAVATTAAPGIARTCGNRADSYRATARYEVRTTAIGLANTSFDAQVRC
jgi:hypothetical protein